MKFTTPYVQTYSCFFLTCLTPEFHKRTCGYWYTIMENGMSHTAFATSEELIQWLTERGLKITDTLPNERGTHKSMRISGTYKSASYMDINAFKAIQPILEIKVMDNGEYTLGKVTEDEGVRTVHYLNVNVRKWMDRYQVVINPEPTEEHGDQHCRYLVVDTKRTAYFVEPGVIVRGFDNEAEAERYRASL